MKSELVIFGRSPFINDVDVENLLANYTTVGFNQFGRLYPVDYLFFFDAYYDGFKKTTLFCPHWFPEGQGDLRYAPKPLSGPMLDRIYQGGALALSHKYYTVSLALNWALLNGIKTIYLVGIDHVETDTAFVHHDGEDCESVLTPDTHQALKQFVYRCAEHATIYQCNPAVKDDWELPFKDISELYAKENA